MSMLFVVEKTWRLPGREGLLVQGKLTGGPLKAGTRLRQRNERTPGAASDALARTAVVEGIEFFYEDGRVTVVVDAASGWIREGMRLIDASATRSRTA